ncbi:MAG: HAMP domain-containing histidine kinase [candidate division KSB1 bacterium]|nr:HAMP domain-containing histidine kinase [candidate division KSB1 bacterium]MDZ7272957.1 HAMP domain-containing histidine kinase [candidate division KSB1 bacterium]MDZ7285061.1 HAMP domain-containing histidine kinase [candidate division KSB1 bacterium]MDZ7298093.1 HAMP domain-containing histidine kinase [candidate division KSB1 bacterium]MDZ7349274.1 HAMP domain-containing histidine kinase [candidate division KSB1 bacterium]
MFRPRIRTQLILFLILQVGTLLALAGFYLHGRMRAQIESELADKLVALAVSGAQLVASASGVTPVISLVPGDEASRTVQALRQACAPLLAAGKLNRLVICDRDSRLLFDSRSELAIGSEYVRLRFDREEMMRAWHGWPCAAKLFFDAQQRPFKAAYAPLTEGGEVRALVGIEGSAASLAAVAEMQRVLWSIAALGLLAAALSGIIFAQRLTSPLERLRAAAQAIGHGAPSVSFEVKGTEEIRFLAQTMQQMHTAIVNREQNLHLMLAGVAHEIRNPLGGIELFAGMLESDAPAALKPQVQRIRAEVRRLENTVRDFLDYARPRPSVRQQVRVRPIIEDVHTHLHSLHPAVTWRLRVAATASALVDEEQLRRMVLNLAGNAIEAMNGSGELEISAAAAHGRLQLSIKDSGPGVAPELREKIFEPFFTTRPQGSGLGLALVRRFAELNGGHIELVPSKKGAHFRLTLPQEPPAAGGKSSDV